MFFFVIGVHGSIARDAGGHFFDGIGRRIDDGSIRLMNAHGANFHLLVTGVVAENEFAQLLNSGIALHSDSYGEIALAGAVVFKPCSGVVLLDNKWFLREINGGKILRRSFARRKVGFIWDLEPAARRS